MILQVVFTPCLLHQKFQGTASRSWPSWLQCGSDTKSHHLLSLDLISSWLVNLPPPATFPHRNMALIRAYWPLVSRNKAFLSPYFWGGEPLGRGRLTSHDFRDAHQTLVENPGSAKFVYEVIFKWMVSLPNNTLKKKPNNPISCSWICLEMLGERKNHPNGG